MYSTLQAYITVQVYSTVQVSSTVQLYSTAQLYSVQVYRTGYLSPGAPAPGGCSTCLTSPAWEAGAGAAAPCVSLRRCLLVLEPTGNSIIIPDIVLLYHHSGYASHCSSKCSPYPLAAVACTPPPWPGTARAAPNCSPPPSQYSAVQCTCTVQVYSTGVQYRLSHIVVGFNYHKLYRSTELVISHS